MDVEKCPIREEVNQECAPKCAKYLENYNACAVRIQGKEEVNCQEWWFDYQKCLDKCVRFQFIRELLLLFILTLSTYVCLFLCLSVYLCLSLRLFMSVSLSVCVYLPVCSSLSLSSIPVSLFSFALNS